MPTKSKFLGDNLRAARQARGLSTAKMADYLGLNSSQTLQNYEKGRIPRDMTVLEMIAEKLRVSVDDLLLKPLKKTSFVYPESTSPVSVSSVRENNGPQKPRTIEDRLEHLENQQQEIIELLTFIRNHQVGETPKVEKRKPTSQKKLPKVATDSPANVIRYPARCLGSVAAGTPTQDEIQTVVMLDSPIPSDEYLLQVSGESMKPKIHDGSYIKVRDFRGQGYPKKGTIIVYADGTGATLKVYDTRKGDEGTERVLKSINPDYPDVEVMEGGEIQAVYVGVVEVA